jgi:biotin carboxyl carrier protein
MAGLTPDTRPGRDTPDERATKPAGNGDAAAAHDGVVRELPGVSATPIDARAVRARLAPASRVAEEAPLRLAPAADPDPDDTGVLAQRQVLVDGAPTAVTLTAASHDRHVLAADGARTRLVLGPARRVAGAVVREVLVDGFRFEVEVEPERIASLRERASRGRATGAQGGPLDVRAIIPGKVASVSVVPGDAVIAGQQLLVVEAMKMQNELRAPRDGTIDRVGVAPGVNIEVGDLLVVIS